MKTNLNPITLILLLAIVLPFIACSKLSKCKGESTNAGIIIRNTALTEPLCSTKVDTTEFVIGDRASFFQIYDSTCSLPAVDFATESILGLYAEGGCDVSFAREVSRIDSEKRYHYKITVYQCGNCKSLTYSHNLVAVPKLPSDYKVTFEVENK